MNFLPRDRSLPSEKMVDALRQALRGAEEQNTRMQDPLALEGNDEKNGGQIGKKHLVKKSCMC